MPSSVPGADPALILDIAEVLDRFPDYRVAVLVARGLTVTPGRDGELDAYVRGIETDLLDEWAGRPVSEIPEIRDWRTAYKGFGIKSTSYRSSVERLIRTLQRHGRLPRISNLVDLYNAVSVRYRMPAGADDLALVRPPLAFRFSRPGDSFVRLGDPGRGEDPPKAGEVVYADREKVLCRRWNWYQDDRSATSPATRAAVLTVQTMAPDSRDRLAAAATELAARIARHCGGVAVWEIADRDRPAVTVEGAG